VIHIQPKNGANNPHWVAAGLVDVIDSGCGLALMSPLKPGSTVFVRGRLGQNRGAENFEAGVRWCVGKTDGTYRAGLEFLGERSTFPLDEQPDGPDKLDCYEVMQLSPNADRNVISRAYRKLALRYHPDNTETGNSEIFIRLSRAYQILSDPKKRAHYDRNARAGNRPRWKSSDPASASAGRAGREREHLDIKYGGEWERFRPSVGALRGWDAALQRS
jgi:hypothetical protein